MEQNAALKIFLVDDDVFCLDLYRQYLANLGQKEVFPFTSSPDCLNKLSEQPDLIFLDYYMDSINGIETLKKIKRFNPNALVVFISSQEEIPVAVNALKYGAFDYLSKKQVSEDKLRVIVDKAIMVRQLVESNKRKSRVNKVLASLGLGSLILLFHKLTSK